MCPVREARNHKMDISQESNDKKSDQTRGRCQSRCQRKLSVYLHTHVVLIIVCSLAILDAVCVIGQLISDILIMQEKLSYFEKIDEDLTKELLPRLPEINQSIHDNWNLHAILTVLQGTDIHSRVVRQVLDDSLNFSQVNDISEVLSLDTPYMTGHHRVRRSIEPKVPGHEVDHGALYELTHACHLGSMAILSLLLLETLLKVFAMGKKLKDHKLEIFDALIVTISWCLDVGLWEGIWAHPGTQAATFLMYLLPWRVIRLVNSFVLVIQEKEHVHLKIVKQRLRQALKRSKETLYKAACYRHEAKAMAGLCRKLGASESEITSCSPSGKAGRRGSVQSVLERAASLTFISTLSSVGSQPSLFDVGGTSSEEEDDEDERHQHQDLERSTSNNPTQTSDSSTTLDSSQSDSNREEQDGYENVAFESDNNNSSFKASDKQDKLVVTWEVKDVAEKEKDESTDKTADNGTRL